MEKEAEEQSTTLCGIHGCSLCVASPNRVHSQRWGAPRIPSTRPNKAPHFRVAQLPIAHYPIGYPEESACTCVFHLSRPSLIPFAFLRVYYSSCSFLWTLCFRYFYGPQMEQPTVGPTFTGPSYPFKSPNYNLCTDDLGIRCVSPNKFLMCTSGGRDFECPDKAPTNQSLSIASTTFSTLNCLRSV